MRAAPERRRRAAMGLGLIGEGPLAGAYTTALRQLRDVRLVWSSGEAARCAGGGSPAWSELGTLLNVPSVRAVVVVGGKEAFSLASRALVAGKHVLVCGSGAFSPRQVRTLERIAESRARLLLFGEERFLSPSVAFLRKMLAEGDGLWLPRYVRSLNVRAATGREPISIASLAGEDLALCLHLLNRPALSVSAVSSRSSGAAAAFLNVTFAEGVVAGLQISLAEACEARQLVVALTDKTLLLDESDRRAPLKVISHRRGPCGEDSYRAYGVGDRPRTEVGALCGTEPAAEPVLEQSRRFVEAVALEDLSQGNARFWARVAGVWEAAESSMAEGGVPMAVAHQTPEKDETRRSAPRLRLIHSGGIQREVTLPRRSLTLVGG